ncbi:hypothetical protein ACP70R_047997 [Stipagrostis hirtigluma subsp. patula]
MQSLAADATCHFPPPRSSFSSSTSLTPPPHAELALRPPPSSSSATPPSVAPPPRSGSTSPPPPCSPARASSPPPAASSASSSPPRWASRRRPSSPPSTAPRPTWPAASVNFRMGAVGQQLRLAAEMLPRLRAPHRRPNRPRRLSTVEEANELIQGYNAMVAAQLNALRRGCSGLAPTLCSAMFTRGRRRSSPILAWQIRRMDASARRRALVVRGSALVVVVCAWLFVRFRRRIGARRSITYGPMLHRDRERAANLRFIYESDDSHCVELLRMKRAPFFQLCDLFRSRGLLKDSIHTNIEEQVAMFLHVVGHNQRFRVIKMTFRRSIETISRYFQEVLFAVGELRDEMIQPPSSAVPPKILGSRRWYPFFKDCVGAIDGTHVLARVPEKDKAAFLGRKHTTTQNVLAAVDFDLCFTYVLAGWEGSAHDALILADALQRQDGLKVPQGKFYLNKRT